MIARLCLLLFVVLPLAAAPQVAKLAPGLTYVRIRELPADLPAQIAVPACILDVRFAGADAAGAGELAAWIKSRARAKTPVIMLVNAGTSPTLLDALDELRAAPGIISIGSAAGNFTPDIVTHVSLEAEKKAFEAGTDDEALKKLLSDRPDKPRRDEAQLVLHHQNGTPPPANDPGDPAAGAAAATPAALPEPPLVDIALQRAVQLHQTLLALGRLPKS